MIFKSFFYEIIVIIAKRKLICCQRIIFYSIIIQNIMMHIIYEAEKKVTSNDFLNVFLLVIQAARHWSISVEVFIQNL